MATWPIWQGRPSLALSGWRCFLVWWGVYWLALGFGGMRLGRTRGFGWRAQELVGTDALGGGRLWLLAGSALLIAAILIWIVKS